MGRSEGGKQNAEVSARKLPMTASEYLSAQPVVTRRLFALLLLSVVAVVGWQAIALPVGQLILSQESWRENAVRQLAYTRGIVATESQAREQLQKLHATSTWHRLFQDSSVGSGDQLKAEVAQALNAAGATTLHLTSLPAENEGSLRKFGLRVVATLDAGQLRRFMESLRARSHYLRVDQLSLTSPLVQSPNINSPLQLKADIFGYSKGGSVIPASVDAPARRTPK